MNFKYVFKLIQKNIALAASVNLMALSMPLGLQAAESNSNQSHSFKLRQNDRLSCPKELFQKQWKAGHSNGFFQTAPYGYCKNKVTSFDDISIERFYDYLENHPLASLGKPSKDWIASCGGSLKNKIQVAEYFYGMNQIRQTELTVNQAIAGINRVLGYSATKKHLFCRDYYIPETTEQCQMFDQCKPVERPERELTMLAAETFDALVVLRTYEDGLERILKKSSPNQKEIETVNSQIAQIRFTYPWLNGKEFEGGELKFEPFGKQIFKKRYNQYRPDLNNMEPSYRTKAVSEIREKIVKQFTTTKEMLNDFKLKLVSASRCYNNPNLSTCSSLTETMAQLPPLQLFDKNSSSKLEKMSAHYFNLAHDCNDMRASKKMGHQAAAAIGFAVALSVATVGLSTVAAGAQAAVTSMHGARLASTSATAASSAMSMQGPIGIAMSETVASTAAASIPGLQAGLNYALTSTAATTMLRTLDTGRIVQVANTTNNIMNVMAVIDVLGLGLDVYSAFHECNKALEVLTPLSEYSKNDLQCPNVQSSKQQLVADYNACFMAAGMNLGFYAIPAAVLLPRAFSGAKTRILRRGAKIKTDANNVSRSQKISKQEGLRQLKIGREKIKKYLQDGITEVTKAVPAPVKKNKAPTANAEGIKFPQQVEGNLNLSPAPKPQKPRVMEMAEFPKPDYPLAKKKVEPVKAEPAKTEAVVKAPKTATQPNDKYSNNLDDYQGRYAELSPEKQTQMHEMYKKRKEFADIYESYKDDPAMLDKITGYIYHRRLYKRYEEVKSPTNKKIAVELEGVLKTPQKTPDNFKFEHSPSELSEAIIKYSTDERYADSFEYVKGDRAMEELLAEFILVHKKRGFDGNEIETKLSKAFRSCE